MISINPQKNHKAFAGEKQKDGCKEDNYVLDEKIDVNNNKQECYYSFEGEDITAKTH